MGANSFSNLQKCGEILMDIKSKNRKTKTYIFHCTFCNIECDQLKKFSLHIGEEHLNNFEDILNQADFKFETEPEEFVDIEVPDGKVFESSLVDKISEHRNTFEDNLYQSDFKFKTEPEEFLDIEVPNVKVFESSLVDKISVNAHTLDTVHPATTVINHDVLNSEVNQEIKYESSSNFCDEEGMDLNAPIDGSDKEEMEKLATFQTREDARVVVDSGTEDDITADLDQMPLKKRQLNVEGNTFKQTSALIDLISEDSKDTDSHVEKESNAVKRHTLCKKRWKNIDVSALPVLIEMYKKYEVLWQVNDIAFGIYAKRNETFGKMIDELKTDHNLNKNLEELQDYIDYINYIFFKEKEQELKCELDKTEFKPITKFYQQLSFLRDSQGPFKCSNCNEIVTKYDRYQIHVAQHNGSIPFQCRLCEAGFHKFDNYLRHVARHLDINSYHCNVCGKGYPFKSELDGHLTSHTGVKPYLCPICGAGFRARQGYDNHVRRHEKRFRYECHICKHGFNHLCKLNSHIKSHLNIRDVICNVCGKGFTASRYLQRHKLIHDVEKRYKCNVCGKAFAQNAGLRAHRKQHQP